VPTLDVSSPTVAIVSAIVLGFLTGAIPIGMAEATAVAIGLVTPPWLVVAMWASFTLAHVAAKMPWFWIGARAEHLQRPWLVRHVQRAKSLLERHPRYGAGLLMFSATLSFPPFHLSAIAAGISHLPLARFAAICIIGRAIRFGVLVTAPGLLRQWFG
jgi:membrane protein YqaA with SNARE-associated domain